MQGIYPYYIKFHIIFSIIFLIAIVFITIYYTYGWIKGRPYETFERRLRKTYISLLFADLVIGIILYFFLQKPAGPMDTIEAMNYLSLRFWAIQHFSNIVFVTILCIIGNMLINKTPAYSKKYKYSVFYFGVSTIIIIVSVSLFALRN